MTQISTGFRALPPPFSRSNPWRSARTAVGQAPTWEHLRYVFLIAFITMLWLAPDLHVVSSRDDPLDGREGTAYIQSIWFALLFFGLFSTMDRWREVARQFDITILLLIGWCAATTIFALDPEVSIRRLLFTLICMMSMCLVVSGLKRLDAFIWILLGMCVIEIITKYFFVFAIPSLGIHQSTGLEPELAGLWKGQFSHKNIAGAVCAFQIMLFFAARRVISPLLMLALIVLDLVFFIKTGAKTPLILFICMMVLSSFLLRLSSGLAIMLVVLIGLAFLNVVTLASVVNDDVRFIAQMSIGDSTFTGRVEIWRFLMHYSAQSPWLGAGFQSFWQIGELSPARSEGSNWVINAVYGHQGFLDTIVMIGYTGLILLLLFTVVRPSFDLARVRNRDKPVLEMLVSFWLFGLFTNGTEFDLLGSGGRHLALLHRGHRRNPALCAPGKRRSRRNEAADAASGGGDARLGRSSRMIKHTLIYLVASVVPGALGFCPSASICAFYRRPNTQSIRSA